MRRRSDTTMPISFGRAYTQSTTFRLLFQAGMTLVEQTAVYLDGEGRAAAKALDRPASLAYATESMRLTTRLMQIASWLLLHRSVVEGDMSPSQAFEERRKIRLEGPGAAPGPGYEALPGPFRELVARSLLLQKRVERIDTALFGGVPEPAANPVSEQLRALEAALCAGV